MTEHVAGNTIDFDLARKPACRIETNRGFGLAVTAFATCFCIGAGVLVYVTLQFDAWLFTAIFGGIALIPLLLLGWGLAILLTEIHTTITETEVTEVRRRPWGSSSWTEPLTRYKLQIKVSTFRKSQDSRLYERYYILLRHQDDLKSIELFTTLSPDGLRERYLLFRDQLDVKEDKRIRQYNTDRPLNDLSLYGLAPEQDDVGSEASSVNSNKR